MEYLNGNLSKEEIRKSDLYKRGDCIKIWVNEGEFFNMQLDIESLRQQLADAQLQRERQEQPTPSQSEPVGWMYKSSKATDIVEHKFCEETCKLLPKDCVISPLYTKPQPTSQESLPKELNIDDTPCHLPQAEASSYMNGWNACLESIKELSQPTPSQSEPVARFVRNSNSCAIITLSYIEDGALLYTKPQPNSQEYCCTHSWQYAKNKAWSNRNLKLCKCDHNESCAHCYPDDFKDGGKWDLCKPEKAN